jgi:pyruvate ferredoxin oxidoreductase gamma subunit
VKEIRIHARAGQGAITTAALTGYVYFLKGMYPYAFPHFGAARMGAPMNAFVCVDARLRSQIYEPDYLVIVDPTLMRGYNCFSGLRDQGVAVIDGPADLQLPKLKPGQKAYVVPAKDIALKTIGRPLSNTTLLGAFAAATNEFALDALLEAIRKRFQGKALEGNIRAVQEGYEFTRKLLAAKT